MPLEHARAMRVAHEPVLVHKHLMQYQKQLANTLKLTDSSMQGI